MSAPPGRARPIPERPNAGLQWSSAPSDDDISELCIDLRLINQGPLIYLHSLSLLLAGAAIVVNTSYIYA